MTDTEGQLCMVSQAFLSFFPFSPLCLPTVYPPVFWPLALSETGALSRATAVSLLI